VCRRHDECVCPKDLACMLLLPCLLLERVEIAAVPLCSLQSKAIEARATPSPASYERYRRMPDVMLPRR